MRASSKAPAKKAAKKKAAPVKKKAAASSSDEKSKGGRPPASLTAVNKAIRAYEQRLSSGTEIKLAEYVRLLELKKDMTSAQLRNITVCWIDPWEKQALTEE